MSPAGLNRGDCRWHTISYIFMSCWPVLSGTMHDAFYISRHVYLFWWETCACCRQGSITTARNNCSLIKDPLKEARILKSICNKHMVVMKAVCENPLAMMLARICVFRFCTIRSGRSWKLSTGLF